MTCPNPQCDIVKNREAGSAYCRTHDKLFDIDTDGKLVTNDVPDHVADELEDKLNEQYQDASAILKHMIDRRGKQWIAQYMAECRAAVGDDSLTREQRFAALCQWCGIMAVMQ